MSNCKGISVAIAVLAGMVMSACHNGSTTSSAAQGSEQAFEAPRFTGTHWQPKWNTAPDRSRKAKAQLVPSVAFADDGFRGSPIFENPDQKTLNAEAREAFVQSFPTIPECTGITLKVTNPNETDFVLQIFNGIDGRTGRLLWVLYRTDTLGESAHGEGTGADTKWGQDGITRAICSTIRNAVTPESGSVDELQLSIQGIRPSIDAWKKSARSLEASFSHVRYSLPRGFSALSEDVRTKENQKRYETQLTKALKEEGPNIDAPEGADGNQATETRKTEVFPRYDFLVASPTAPTTSETNQLPRVNIYAEKRNAMLMEAGDPAGMVTYVPQVSVLRGPEEVMISDHKFVRTDFRFHSGDYLSKFSTVYGDYLLEFDFRADNEKDLKDMVNSMGSVVFKP